MKQPCTILLPEMAKADRVKKFRPIIVASILSRPCDKTLLRLVAFWLQEYSLNQFGNRRGTQAAAAIHAVRIFLGIKKICVWEASIH